MAFPASQSRIRPSRYGTRVDDEIEILVGGPTGRADEEAERRGIPDAEPHEERLADLLAFEPIDRREGGRRPVVEHADRTFRVVGQLETLGEESREPAGHTQVRVGGAAADELQPARQAHGQMAPAQPEREDRVAQVVPVDDESRAPQPRDDPRHLQRRNRRRVLDENQVGLRNGHQRHTEPQAGPQRVVRGDEAEQDLRALDAEPELRRRQPVDADARIGEKLGQRRAFMTDHVHVHARGGERVRVILHAGTASQIPDDDDGRAHLRRRTTGE